MSEIPMTEATVAVTGCAGFIGARASQLLLESGHTVVGIDCLLPDLYSNAPKEARIARLTRHPRFEFHRLDLRTDPLESVLVGTSVVLHFAAMAGLAMSWTHPELYESNNIVGTSRLLQAMAVTDAHLVHASTSSVYGVNARGDESMPLEAASPYGVTKVAAEELVRAHESDGSIRGATILRYFSVYGPDQRADMAYARFCEALLGGTEITINGDGTQTRSNTFVDDAVRAAVWAGERKLPGVTMNIAGTESIRIADAIDVLASVIGVRPRVRFGPQVPGDQQETFGIADLAFQNLGWRPTVSIQEGLKRQATAAIDEYRSRAG